MKSILPEISIRQAAITAGIAILVMTLAAVSATDVTIGPLIVPNDPTTTIENIKNNEMLFRFGIFSWIVVLISDVVAAWGLYIFLSPVNKGVSFISAWLRLIYTAILGTSIMNFNYVQELLFDSGYYAGAMEHANLESQVWLFLTSFDSSWSIGLIVFALHILLLGYLGLKSNYVPRLLSILLIIGFVGYILIHLCNLLIPENENLIQILGWIFILPMLSEVALGIWLLLKGKNVQIHQ